MTWVPGEGGSWGLPLVSFVQEGFPGFQGQFSGGDGPAWGLLLQRKLLLG